MQGIEILQRERTMVNPNNAITNSVLSKLIRNKGYCISKEGYSLDNRCPCKKYRVNGECSCGLYVMRPSTYYFKIEEIYPRSKFLGKTCSFYTDLGIFNVIPLAYTYFEDSGWITVASELETGELLHIPDINIKDIVVLREWTDKILSGITESTLPPTQPEN